MVPHQPSPEDCPGLNVEFVNVEYTWEEDHEYIPYACYDGRQLGQLDLELSGDGHEVYLDGATDDAKELFHRLGGVAWAKLAYEMHGYIPLAGNFHTPGRTYTFDEESPENLPLAA